MSKIFPALIFFFSILPIWGLDLHTSQIADDSGLRRDLLREGWFTESHARVLAQRPTIRSLENGDRVQVSAIEGRYEFGVYLSRELIRGRIATEDRPAMPRRPTGVFPGWAQGSWLLMRRIDTGEPTLLRIFLRSDQHTFIQFRPLNNERSEMDAVLYGGFLVRNLSIPVPFERLYTMPLNDVLALAGNRFPIRYFNPNPEYYRYTRAFISQVRPHLCTLRFADDGAIDEHGNFVHIEDLSPQNPATAGLNCSGFAKWLIDGILRPITGQRLPIPPLREPFGDRGSLFTVHWEGQDARAAARAAEERISVQARRVRDPYFGLDWIRNLAAEANGVLRSPPFRNLEEFEVRDSNFSSVLVNVNRTFQIHSYPGFLPEAGFGIEGLHPLLYTLAINYPFKFYLAAVNTEIGAPVTPTNLRGTPRLRQFFHIAALVPFFNEYGDFRVVVFESAAETSFARFRTRYPGHFINLVQIPVVTTFSP